MSSGSKRILIAAALVYAVALTASCTSSSSKPAPAPPAAASAGRTEMKAVVSVKELMRYTIDPISDNIFDAVTDDATKKGVVETVPKTDEDWEKVQIGAVSLAEAIDSPQAPTAIRAAWRRQQQHGAQSTRTVAGSDSGQARRRPGVVGRQDSGAPERGA